MRGKTQHMFSSVKLLGIPSGLYYAALLLLCFSCSFWFNIDTDIQTRQLHSPYFNFTCFLIGAIICFLTILFRRSIFINTLDIAVLLFLLYMLIQPLYIMGLDSYQSNAYNYISYITIYLFVRVFYHTPNFYKCLIIGILVLAIFNVILAGLQFFHLAAITNRLNLVTGLFVNPGQLGGFLACVTPLLLMIKTDKIWLLWIKGLMLFIFITVLILSASRSSWLAILIPLFIYYYPKFKNIGTKYKWIIVSLSVVIAGLFAVLLYQINPDSIQGRILIWKISLQMFFDAPIFGHGLGAVNAYYNQYQSIYFALSPATIAEKMLAGTVYSTFNEYLRILIEGGLVGLLLFGIIIVQIFRNLKDLDYHLFPMALSICSLFIFSLFSYPFSVETNCLIFFVLLALISSNIKEGRIINLFRGLPFLALPAYIYLIISTYLTIEAIHAWKKVSPLWDYNEYQALCKYKEIEKQLSDNWSFMYNYGSELSRRGYSVDAVIILEQCRKIGNNVMVNNQLGQAYEHIGHYKQAEEYYLQSTYMVPSMLSQKYALFKLYEKTGSWDQYLRTAEEIEQTPVKVNSREAWLIKKETQSSILKYKKK